MYKVFIDGGAGTTGLKIHDRLRARKDISIIALDESVRKDVEARREAINSSDLTFLCLPDDAAKESVSLLTNKSTKIIDTSTAHRTDPLWVYGFPELTGYREKIKNSSRIANPGCHASGFIALVAPLVSAGVLDKGAALSCFSLTGYTGGGKKMIAEYEDTERDVLLGAPRQYALTQSHKHLPEMKAVTGIENLPAFVPVVADFPCGMEVSVPIFKKDISASIPEIKEIYKCLYTTGVVRYSDENEGGFLSASAMAGKDSMTVSVYGNEDRILLVSRFDNLGKGASGAAIQNMNILLGIDETEGLVL